MVALLMASCQDKDFDEYYADPATLATTTVEKQYAGFMQSNLADVMPSYSAYFVIGRPTLMVYTQTRGFTNSIGRYTPGDAPTDPIYQRYYSTLFQFREMEKLYNNLTPEEQNAYRIFMVTGKIYLYDYTQKVIDLFGDWPFTEAGRLSQNDGDYEASYASFDKAEDLYTLMLDDLKSFAVELNSISLNTGVRDIFNAQDFVNGGDINTWKRYCNSLRLRMLTRVSGVGEFSGRYQSEFAEILNNPATYPIVASNDENIQIESLGEESGLTANFESTFVEGDGWLANAASKAMIDNMVANTDPRLRCVFQPGSEAAADEWLGIDPLMADSDQSTLWNSGRVSIYNNTTFKFNRVFPGLLISAAEVDFFISEYYLGNNDALAKSHYEKGVTESVDFYYYVRSLATNFTDSPTIADLNPVEIVAYLAGPGVSWDAAVTNQAKLSRLADQKWLDYNMVKMYDNWAEVRRLNLPELSFMNDNSAPQTTPPTRFAYPSNERTFNAVNYGAVSSEDNLTTKLFWDVD